MGIMDNYSVVEELCDISGATLKELHTYIGQKMVKHGEDAIFSIENIKIYNRYDNPSSDRLAIKLYKRKSKLLT